MYESPIELFSVEDYSKQIDEQIEKAVYEVVTKVGINVNREELIKALEYDRNQYEKGYADGRRDGIEWHPYPQEKPDSERDCLITTHLGMGKYGVQAGWLGESGWHSDDELYYDDEVTAWAELPKPYKEGVENE